MKKKFFSIALLLSMLISFVIPVTVAVADEHVHNLVHYDVEASTCLTYGHIEVWYCADCNSRYTDAAATNKITARDMMLPLDPNNHVNEPTLSKSGAATCTTDGYNQYYYSCCGTTYTETVYATGHSWDEGVVTKEATCAEEGEEIYTCKVCGETKTETISTTGIHDWDTNGFCTVCGGYQPATLNGSAYENLKCGTAFLVCFAGKRRHNPKRHNRSGSECKCNFNR